ncbi:MAG: hypothetical protein WBD50_06295 [Candidatus Rhabdochlamydia sp.]
MTIGNISTVTSSSAYNQEPDWYKSLWQASRLGKLDEIKSIIENFNITPESSPGHFEQCVMVAGREGYKNIIDFFLSLENTLKAITLKGLTYALDPGSECFASEDHRKEIIDDILSRLDKDSSISPEYLHEVFKAALAKNRIKVVEAITKFIDPEHIFEALKSMSKRGCTGDIESEGVTTSRYYGDLIKATINSLTPERSYGVLKIALNNNHAEVVMAIIKSRPSEKLQSIFT